MSVHPASACCTTDQPSHTITQSLQAAASIMSRTDDSRSLTSSELLHMPPTQRRRHAIVARRGAAYRAGVAKRNSGRSSTPGYAGSGVYHPYPQHQRFPAGDISPSHSSTASCSNRSPSPSSNDISLTPPLSPNDDPSRLCSASPQGATSLAPSSPQPAAATQQQYVASLPPAPSPHPAHKPITPSPLPPAASPSTSPTPASLALPWPEYKLKGDGRGPTAGME